MKKKAKSPGETFKEKILATYLLEDPQDLERLAEACRCLDMIQKLQKQVDKDGMFIQDRFCQIREHPGLKAIRGFQQNFMRLVRELGLDQEVDAPRPPSLYE